MGTGYTRTEYLSENWLQVHEAYKEFMKRKKKKHRKTKIIPAKDIPRGYIW